MAVPDYNAVGIETTFFKITYNPNGSNVVLDLTQAVKVWEMKNIAGTGETPRIELTYSSAVVLRRF